MINNEKVRHATRTVAAVLAFLCCLPFCSCSMPIDIGLESEAESNKAASISVNAKVELEEYEYNIPERYATEGIKNIVRRARQVKEFTWVPLTDMTGFNGDYMFERGTQIFGIPYGQPVYSGEYVLYGASLEKFYNESLISDSVFYTGQSQYTEISTYYALDCSAFLSYTWNTKNRLVADNLVAFGDNEGNSYKDIQVGDALIRTGENAHVVLVTGVKEDAGNNVCWIEITEQTPPITKRTRYGADEFFSLDEFVSLYTEDGYYIYRNTDYRDGMPYTHNCVSPIDDEKCEKCSNRTPFVKLDSKVENGELVLSVNYTCPQNVTDITYVMCDEFYYAEKYQTVKETPAMAEDGTILTTIPKKTNFIITDKKSDDYNSTVGKTRYNSCAGWVDLSACNHVIGNLTKTSPKAASSFKKNPEGAYAEIKIPVSWVKNEKVLVYAKTDSDSTYLAAEIRISDVSVVNL